MDDVLTTLRRRGTFCFLILKYVQPLPGEAEYMSDYDYKNQFFIDFYT